MRFYHFYSCVFLSIGCLFFAAGCPKGTEPIAPPDDTGNRGEIFQQTVKTLNSLEDHPILEGQVDEGLLRSLVSRLDKWVQNRPQDPMWQSDEVLVKMYETARNSHDRTRLLASLLKSAKGIEHGPESIPVKDAIKEIPDLCTEIETSFNQLAGETGIEFFANASGLYADLGRRFANLAKRDDLEDSDITAFTANIAHEPFDRISYALQSLSNTLDISSLKFRESDAEYLMQSVWMRNISNWAKGDKQSDLDRVYSLFDWTICNIDLRVGSGGRQEPWQTLLLGGGSQWDRAWVFIELLRQQRIDACLLSVPLSENANIMMPWAVGVLLEGEIYIFLPQIGLPLPGPGGPVISEDGGELQFPEIATLSQVLEDKTLLTRHDLLSKMLDFDPETLKDSAALLLASPWSAAQRMCIMEKELLGEEQKMVLYTSFKAQEKRFEEAGSVKKVLHWWYPVVTEFDSAINPTHLWEMMSLFSLTMSLDMHGKSVPSFNDGNNYPLWAGRILYFKGVISGERSSSMSYMDARFSDRRLVELRIPPDVHLMLLLAKNLAGYWIGVSAYEDKNFDSALYHFEENRIFGGELSPWAGGMQYLKGRIHEKRSEYEKAFEEYSKYPQYQSFPGNYVRIQWISQLKGTKLPEIPGLKELLEEPKKAEETEQSE